MYSIASYILSPSIERNEVSLLTSQDVGDSVALKTGVFLQNGDNQ